jgi:two-component system chemotaxis response regulator CheB
MIRVLVADDSATVREYLASLLGGNPALEVIGTARDGVEAVEQAERLRPDVIVMDVHMPRMNGADATRQIMERAPTRIVMVTASSSRDETSGAFRALGAGALTVVEKPGGPDHPGQAAGVQRLVETVKLMAEVKVVRRWPRRARPVPSSPAPARPDQKIRVIAIGASTGGPQAVAAILGGLPRDLGAPILVVQHIAPGFTAGLAEWLGQGIRLPVKLAGPGEEVRPGTVYLAPEGLQLGITRDSRIRLTKEAAEDGFCPSASHLFQSVADAYGRAAVGILLTGMGRDGAKGLLTLRQAGGVTVAQDEASSVIFGMPGEAVRSGAAEYVLSPDQISGMIRSLVMPG